MRFRLGTVGLALWLAACQFHAVAAEDLAVEEDVFFEEFFDEEEEDPAEEPEKKSELSTEDQTALKEFTKKSSELWLKRKDTPSKTVVSNFKEANELTKEEQEKLDACLPAAQEELGAAWAQKLYEMLEPSVVSSGAGASLTHWKPEQFSQSYDSYIQVSLLDTKAWKEGLKQTLTPEKLSAIETAAQARRARVLERMKDSLGNLEDHMKENYSHEMEPHTKRITQNAEIDADRAKALKKAADAAVKQATTAWRKQADEIVGKMSETELKGMRRSIAQNNFSPLSMRSLKKLTPPQEQPAWKEVLASIITAEERKLFAERKAQAKQRRAEALAFVIITEVDPILGFTDEQRAKLIPTGAKQMLTLPDSFFESGDPNRGYTNLNTHSMLTKLQKIDPKEMEAILDEAQWARWKALTPALLPRSGYSSYERTEPPDEKDPPPANEIEAEQLLSDVLFKQSGSALERCVHAMNAKVDIVCRVTKLAPEHKQSLLTAAKGAAEVLAQQQFSQGESYLRQQMQNVPPARLAQQLANFSMPSFGRRAKEVDPPMWTTVLERVLDAEQQRAWQADNEQRAVWRTDAAIASVVTDVEQSLVLKPEQMTALKTKIEQSIKDYGPEMDNYFSGAWHLQGYYNKVPIALIPEEQLKEIFIEAEYEALKERCLQNALNYAENIKRNHEQRVKSTKKKEAP